MKNKKKKAILSALLAALLLLSGCASGTPAETEPAETESEVVVEEETAEEVPAPLSGPRVIVDGRTSYEHELTAEELEAYPQTTNLPTLYITLDDGLKLRQVQHGVYSPGRYSLVYNGSGITDMPIEMRGRGNFSWSFSQKTYGLKLGEAAPLLGMGKGKKWVLITTWSDKTLLRNFITLNNASELLEMQYAVKTRFVDVYVNDSYNGLYVLSEKISLGENRVDAEALFECEIASRHGGNHQYCIVCPSGCHILFKEPIDDEELTKDEKDAIYKQYKQLLIKADVAMTKGIDVYSRYIDVDSFVDWYIVNELAKNYDSGFTTSCYCYAKDGKIYMGPCWDYDTCYGNQNVATCLWPEGYHVADSPWYSILTADEGFKEALHRRWTQLTDDGKVAAFVQMIDDQAAITAESEKLDHQTFKDALRYDGLRGRMSTRTYEAELEYLKEWVNSRIAWLNTEWYDENLSNK